MSCPLCSGDSRRCFHRSGYWIRTCERCGHRFAELKPAADHVDRLYDDSYFFGGGAGFADYLQEGELLRQRGRRYAEILAQYAPRPGLVLDVGAAAGFLLEAFLDRGWHGMAIEPNQTMADHLRHRLGCPVHTGALEDFDSTARFDLVLMIQVIAHFADLHAALAVAAGATRAGGLWLVETWDRTSLTARLFGRHWHEYSPPTVLHWFSRDSLIALAASYGFEPLEAGRMPKRISAAHAKSLLRYRLQGTAMERLDPLLAALPDRLSLRYPGDDLFWLLLRKS